jgi:hypothetical protein
MTEFTATNGVKITPDGRSVEFRCTGSGRDHHLTRVESDALREFFRAEEDERLGRWRWPQNPEWLVKYIGDHTVVVVNEKNFWVHVGKQGEFNHFHFRDARSHGDNLSDKAAAYKRAAWAFFAAHPDLCPQPWHDAQPGDVWVLDTRSDLGTDRRAWIISDRPEAFWSMGQGYMLARSTSIIDGKRIWPEVSE